MIKWDSISLQDLAAYICEELRKSNIDVVLVGGACVSIYSENRYQSYALDYVTYEDVKKVKKALEALGFMENRNYFQHENCSWLIEFVAPPIAVGNESVIAFNHFKTPLGTIKMLKPIDSVKDRLASFYHWNDKECLEQAILITISQSIDLKEIEKWSIRERQEEKYEVFRKCLLKKIQ